MRYVAFSAAILVSLLLATSTRFGGGIAAASRR